MSSFEAGRSGLRTLRVQGVEVDGRLVDNLDLHSTSAGRLGWVGFQCPFCALEIAPFGRDARRKHGLVPC